MMNFFLGRGSENLKRLQGGESAMISQIVARLYVAPSSVLVFSTKVSMVISQMLVIISICTSCSSLSIPVISRAVIALQVDWVENPLQPVFTGIPVYSFL